MRDELTASTEAAWDIVAQKYASDVERDIALLKSGGSTLTSIEQRFLGDLSTCRAAIHLQCSHGSDTLSLLRLGTRRVVGLDISAKMLAQARAKSDALGVDAQWVQSDVLDPPSALLGTFDLVFTGRGATPWIADIERWGRVVTALLRPGGRLLLHEAHPLTWVWAADTATHSLGDDRSYFDTEPRANDNFPARAVDRLAGSAAAPIAWERQWTLGQIVTAAADAGLRIERLEEHAEIWWPAFPLIAPKEIARLPHMFTLMARRPTA